MIMTTPDTELRLSQLATMWLIRLVEDRSEQLFREAKVRGSMHLCAGQEAVCVGACSVMEPGDALSFTYRSHGWALARGVAPESVFAEFFGRDSGCSRGRGGSKHLSDWSRRILPSNAIVGGGVPLANGVALAAQYKGTTDAAIAVFGDGATNQGVVHEAMGQAVIWKSPVIYICENNEYAELTPADEMLPVTELRQIAAGYDMPAVTCDGMDVDEVAKVVTEALARARAGQGPTFIEAKTYRYCGHMTGDREAYRSREEVDSRRRSDPITLVETRLRAEGVDNARIEQIRTDAQTVVALAEERAWNSPEPDPADIKLGTPSWTVVSR
jgi:pyruvate dehydrogenase E1 component alpha subunit